MIHTAAPFVTRTVAFLIDSVFIIIVAAILSLIKGVALLHHFPSNWQFQLFFVFYLTMLPVFWSGHTLGKRITAIRIMKRNGTPVGFFTMFIRVGIGLWGLGALTFGITTLISLIMIFIRNDKRGLHDLLADTYVTNW